MDRKINHYRTEDFAVFKKDYSVNFFNSLSGFKSINLCGTKNALGLENLTIFNTVFHVGSKPPFIGMVSYPMNRQRDTLANIRETGYYTLNHITEKIYFKAHQTAAVYPSDKSEFEMVGLTPQYSENHPAPYVLESTVKIGLKCVEEIPLKSNGKIIIIGEIIEAILPEDCILKDGMIDPGMTGTITSSGMDTYYSTQKIVRLSFANTNNDLGVIG